MTTESLESRRRRYDRDSKATINRSAISYISRIDIPEDVERREFHAPCFRCGDRGECRHRRSFFPESQSIAANG
jgi:hypothetical protein